MSDDEYSEDEVTQRIILHVYDDESKEFTSLTTYHGMIRIYTSHNWPSRIFWSLVVVTCLTLFMIHSGMMLSFYKSRSTFTHPLDAEFTPKYLPRITICKENNFDQDSLKEFAIPAEMLRIISLVFRQQSLSQKELKRLEQFTNEYVMHHNKQFDVGEFVNKTSLGCHKVLAHLQVGHRNLNACDYAEPVVTEMGQCWTILNFPIKKAVDRIVIDVHNTDNDQIVYHVHSPFLPPAILAKGIHIPQGKTAISLIRPYTQNLLEHDDWGTCGNYWNTTNMNGVGEYNLPGCQRLCLGHQYTNDCGCFPYFLTQGNHSYIRSCTLEELNGCKPKKSLSICNCRIECKRFRYKMKPPSYVRNENRNHSTIRIDWPSKKLVMQQQMKRFKAVDLLSYVAGSMGLFLGMSCVTLLEIFMYLFKTIWGAINDSRHKGYLEKLLGEKVDEFNDEPINKSMEEIQITTHVPLDHRKSKDTGASDLVVEENIGIVLDRNSKRPSVFRIPQRHIFPAVDERIRSNTGSSSTDGTNMGIGRRKKSTSIPPLAGVNPLKISILNNSQTPQGRRLSNYTGMGGF